ncbi:EAL domain-containing protein [Alkalimonas collagenimarina]|uniref:EAL domain-containing protein n=1 Tax=Alkalimonas collagenimarina TaxID=400390 RepID=A0ABT9GZ32_9GAMM|nr:EAL domain-containing protein [Alkalimonas collagenimarina]MDP4536309.1 EAL domain-containing protein [Alkalimonas collagenimarina]
MVTILVVDDHPDGRELLVTLLGYRGYRMLAASDGREALLLVQQERPDLVIADVLMPVMDGYEFVKQLRAKPDIAQTRVVFYTASYHEKSALDLANKCGVLAVLTKPAEPAVLLSMVEQVLDELPEQTPAVESSELDQQHLRLMTDKLKFMADTLGVANQRYAALIEINLQLASERNSQRLLDCLCQQGRQLVGASLAFLHLPEESADGGAVTLVSGMDASLAALKISDKQLPEAFSLVLREGSTERLMNRTGQPQAVGLPAAYPAVFSLLVAPIASPNKVYGWICLGNRLADTEFNDEDAQLLAILAAQAGRMYEHSSLFIKLQEQEEQFRQLAENINDVFWLKSVDTGQNLYVSPAYEDIWQQSRPEASDQSKVWQKQVHPDDRGLLPALEDEAEQYDITYRIIRPDGSIRWIHDRGFPVFNAEGELYRFAGIAEDITPRKENEEKIARLTRLYAVLSQINSTIVRQHDRQSMFDESCKIVINHGHFGLAWVGYWRADIKKIELAAIQGRFKSQTRRRQVIALKGQRCTLPGGVMAQAVRSKETAFCNDVSLLPRLGASPLHRLRADFGSEIALPLIVGGEVVGLFVLYANEAGFFDKTELALLKELAHDISFALEFIEKEEQTHYLVHYDVLTGLSNRFLFHERLGQWLQSAEREAEQLAVLIIDVVRFKQINDTLGRQVGDGLVLELKRRLQLCVPQAVDLARVGPDQFALALADVRSPGDIARLIKGPMTEELEQPIVVEQQELVVTVRVGVALFPDDGKDAEALFLRAELALKLAKQQAVRYLFFNQTMSSQVAQKLDMEHKLRRAIEQAEFRLYYQPKVCLQTGTIIGMEALIRWQSPELGLVAPFHFIPLLEETGLILEVGNWVLQQAILDLQEWKRQGLVPPRVAINLSALQLRQQHFVQHIEQMLQESPEAALLDFELTESVVIADVADSQRKLGALRALGLPIAIDDFGTGYSSLSYIARLPLDTLKIDRSFVVKMTENHADRMIVSTIITMAHNMNLNVVAEGVDSTEQLALLRELKCNQMQGYLFSKPVPAQDICSLLQQGTRLEL